MIETLSNYRVQNHSDIQRVLSSINSMIADGVMPIVTVSDKKPSRSANQNRLMFKWFRDIHNDTQNGEFYEAGRCKYQYFLPVLERSENEKTRGWYEVLKQIEKAIGYDKFIYSLGKSYIESTRRLSVKEFAEALTSMQIGEVEHYLTEPQMCGLDDRL